MNRTQMLAKLEEELELAQSYLATCDCSEDDGAWCYGRAMERIHIIEDAIAALLDSEEESQ